MTMVVMARLATAMVAAVAMVVAMAMVVATAMAMAMTLGALGPPRGPWP